MRPLKSSLYPYVSSSQFIDLDVRVDLGGNKITSRYPDDKYDRIWSPHIDLYDHARPLYLQALTTYTPDPLPEPSSDRYLITLNATSNSTAPPLLNAVEVFSLLQVKNAMTDLTDVDAILEIKLEYKVNKSWSGDPCAPVNYTWAGVGCSSGRDSPKIISLNLSSSGLTGSLSSSFSKLQNIKILDLSNNRLNGTIPEFFSTMKSLQVLNLSCNSFKGSIPDALQNKVSAGQLTLRNDDAYHHMPTPEHPIVRLKTKKYTKQEIETITDNFATKIGGGGFGGVFRGTLTDGTSVAVKKLSETSKQGLEQFAAEAESLAMLHHRNLVSLLGYCEDDKCVALVYEFMSMGSLEDHIKGNQDFERILGWRERLHVVLEAAQGLDYLHRGGTVPIVHRDVKSNNILLGSNLEAKVSDLGLARAFQSSTQTETETLVCGTHGYLDPEYFRNGILTKKSDVYSFGVVLLEIITGLSPIIKYPNGDVVNLIHYITEKVKQHDITMVADRRFQGNYDINSVWKVMELALNCTQETSPPRPTMADVVAQLTMSMELEKLREGHGTGIELHARNITTKTDDGRCGGSADNKYGTGEFARRQEREHL
ncbi:hypothetical protein LUZ60_008489 [Juncus effusus]|nr:hypothetical protein LUZ60_008489 [Juncus effusus]